MTNADWIRQMSDKELSTLLCTHGWQLHEANECFSWLQQQSECGTVDIKKGTPIWYVDFDSCEIEQGTVFSVRYDKDRLASFAVEFADDFDEFQGEALGVVFFLSESAAQAALVRGQ